MTSFLDMRNWYWKLDDAGTEVWSSFKVGFVPVTDTDYVDWKNSHDAPTVGWPFLYNLMQQVKPEAATWILDNKADDLLPEQVAVGAIAAGCSLKSTKTPALNATYDATGPRWQQMRDEVLYVVSFGDFSGGLDKVTWQAMSGAVEFTSTDDFKSVVRAIGDWLTGWQRFADGQVNTAPPDTVTIP